MIERAPAKTPSPEPRQLQMAMAAVGGLIVINTLLIALAPDASVSSRFVIASLMLWLSAYPAWRHFTERAHGIPYLPAMAAVYFCYYGLPAFRGPLRARGMLLPEDQVENALELALLGEALLFAAFYATRQWKALPRLRLALDLESNATRLVGLSYATEAGRWLVARGAIPLEAGQAVVLLNAMPMVFAGGLFLLLLRGRLRRSYLFAALPLVAFHLALDFATGSVAVPLMTLAGLLFLYVLERGRMPVAALAVIALVIVPSLGTKLEYRRIISRHPEMTTLDKVELFAGLVRDVMAPTGKTSMRDAGEATENRIDHLSAFAYVISRTPSTVPYWGGETYSTLAWTFVPRFLYPDKPQKTLGQDYGHRYGFIGPRDKNTSINLEQTVEMYANFGSWGVVLGMLLMGCIYRVLYRVLNHPDAGDGGILIAARTFTVLLNIESDVSLVFGAIIQEAAVLALVLYLVAHRRRAAAGPAGQPA
jgi:hypothetical protein